MLTISNKQIACLFYFLLCGLQSVSVTAQAQERSATQLRPLVLAHYMPWYIAEPKKNSWGWHWTMNHFDPATQSDGRREIASKYYPLIGPYDSGDRNVLVYHLLLMKLAGIQGVIVDWYGLTDFRDYAILHRNTTRLLQECERLGMKFVVCYEDQTIPALVKANRLADRDRVSHAIQEIEWLGKYWFKSGSYVKLEGKPVLLSFGHSGLTKTQWTQCLNGLANPIAYFSQDIRRERAVGAFGWPSPRAGMQQVDRFLTASKKWPASIPAAFPRFDDIYKEAGVNEGYPKLLDRSGQTLRETLGKALISGSPIVQIATWNDWGEGTQIEPSFEYKYRDLEIVQSCLRRQGGTQYQAADLHLPLQVFKTLNSIKGPAEKQRLIELISNGALEEARSTLREATIAD